MANVTPFTTLVNFSFNVSSLIVDGTTRRLIADLRVFLDRFLTAMLHNPFNHGCSRAPRATNRYP
ncbi:MAG TPA: hypothetical protein VIK01_02465 [Polyangiaceae bacterium]